MAVMIKNAVAIIPARGGSKGIPFKNIVDLAGKPLIAWTIDAALKSASIDELFVTSDDSKILSVAEEYGAQLIERPIELAGDEVLTVPVLEHAIDQIESLGKNFEYLVLLQPTSPLRTSDHIDEAFKTLKGKNASSLISVVEPSHSPLKSFLLQGDYLKGVVNDQYPFMRRQDLPTTYLANGAIYIVNIEEFKNSGSLMTGKCIPFVMDAPSSVDIDIKEDLLNAQAVIQGTNRV